jgi:ketosteroid isomerase-like protein
MSEENVEIVRRGYDHYNRTGEPDYSLLDEAIVYDVSRRVFDPAVYHGHDGVRAFNALIREQWATMRLDPEEFFDSEDEVVVSVRLVGIGRESRAETTAHAAHVWTFRNGKVVRQTTFQTIAEALEAAGLSE